jgi:2,6-dihydroxypyridine 3-monooxygenase
MSPSGAEPGPACAGGRPTAFVVGGSLGGLTAAIALTKVGWDVEVFERSRRPLEGRGAGIVLHPTTVRALGTDLEGLTAQAVRLHYIDERGRVVYDEPCSYRFASYFGLHQALLDRFDRRRYHLGQEVVGIDQSDRDASIELADGRRRSCDLVVCADGIHSQARQRLLPEVSARYAGYVGWRGTVEESELDASTLAGFADAISYCVVPNGHILVYPIPGLDGSVAPGRRLVNWVWYRNIAEGGALDAVLTDRSGVRQPVSVGAGAVRDEVVAELCEHAAVALPPPLAETIRQSREPFVQAVFDIAVPQMAFGRVCLMGDAAFALRPHIAAGTAKAADDAWRIAGSVAISPDVPTALATWEPPQLMLGRSAVERARDAGIRSQFENSWRVGDPLPFGLHVAGDSYLP